MSAQYWQDLIISEKYLRPEDRTHVYPVNDLREHCTSSGWCWCMPSYEQGGALVIHNSKDGREFYEQEGTPIGGAADTGSTAAF